MNSRELRQRRGEMLGKIIAMLNSAGRYRSGRGGLFDCGELGCCLVWMGEDGWDREWYELEKLIDLRKRMEDGE